MEGIQPDETSRMERVPAVSIVLPVYNGERYLRAALDSIFSQSFTDFELIAVDDCSTDTSPAILAEYAAAHPNMRVVTNARNSKLPASLNAGFREARGEWFTWTSDDNLLLPDTLSALVDASKAHEQADIIHADYIVIDEKGAEKARITTGPSSELVIDNRIGCCFIYRGAVDTALGGYDESLFGVEDYDFWLRAARHGFAFHRIPRFLYLYRRHGGSLSDTRAREIHQLVHTRLEREIAAMPRSELRARAWLRLVTRDPYRLRPHLLLRGLRDDPGAVLKGWHAITQWLRSAARVRIFGSASGRRN